MIKIYIMISDDRCPNCGVLGREWEGDENAFVCNSCETIFNKFGIIAQRGKREVE